MKQKVIAIIGTRPEAIKMAPVVIEMRRRPDEFEVLLCSSGQHLDLLDQALIPFDLKPDINLQVMTINQSLSGVAGRLFPLIDQVLEEHQPDWVLLQGDTLTVMVAALACHFRRVKIGHIEAGLRSFDKWHPFPEETNRRVTTVVADLNFAPTKQAYENLIREHVSENDIVLSGNPVVDALLHTMERNRLATPQLPDEVEVAIACDKRIILVTGHRRENFGTPFENICRAIRELADRHDDVTFVYPVHPNPNVRETVERLLLGHPGILLVDPMSYAPFIRLMSTSEIVLTDSGGVQEEAPSLGKPVLIMRQVTERPEGVASGSSTLVGTETESIVRHVEALLEAQARTRMTENPFGDGKAAERIADAIMDRSHRPVRNL